VGESRARDLAMEHRISLYRQWLGLMMHIAVLLLVVLVSVRTNEMFDSGFKGQEPSSDSLSPLVCIVLMGLLAAAAPEVLTSRLMDVIHAIAMARLIWQVLGTPSIYMLVFWNVRMTICRTSLALMHGNVPLTLILNLVYSCVSTCKYASLVKNCVHCGHQFPPWSAVWYSMDSCFVTLVVTAFAYSMGFHALTEARALVRAKTSSQAETTVNTLLMALCDSVIRLCGDFRITAGARSLETLLLKTCGSLAATNFLDVLEESDRARFCDHIQDNRKLADDCPAALVHVHTRDSNGTRVSLQLFTARFTDLNDNVGHLLGILESSREESRLPTGAGLNSHSLTMINQLHLSESAIQSPSTSSASFLPLAQMGDSLDEVAIWFDVEKLVILQTTPACTTIAGPSCEGTDLRDWLVHRDDFIAQVRTYCQTLADFHEGYEYAVPTQQIQGLKLQPPTSMRAQIQYVTDVTFSLDVDGMPDSDSHSTLVFRADFTNIKQVRHKKKGYSRRSRRSKQDAQHELECPSSNEPHIHGQEDRCAHVLSL